MAGNVGQGLNKPAVVHLFHCKPKKKVLESGYQTSATSQSFYTAVFNTARAESSILKTKEGFSLRAAAKKKGSIKPNKRGRKKKAK